MGKKSKKGTSRAKAGHPPAGKGSNHKGGKGQGGSRRPRTTSGSSTASGSSSDPAAASKTRETTPPEKVVLSVATPAVAPAPPTAPVAGGANGTVLKNDSVNGGHQIKEEKKDPDGDHNKAKRTTTVEAVPSEVTPVSAVKPADAKEAETPSEKKADATQSAKKEDSDPLWSTKLRDAVSPLKKKEEADDAAVLDVTESVLDVTTDEVPATAAEDVRVKSSVAGPPITEVPVEQQKPDSPGNEHSVESPKLEAPTPEAPKPEAPKPEAPKPEAPKLEAPKPEAPKPEAPKPEAPKPEAPKPEAPKPGAPKPEAPKPEASKPETSKPETPKAEGSKPEAPKPEAPKPEAPKPEALANEIHLEPRRAAPGVPTTSTPDFPAKEVPVDLSKPATSSDATPSEPERQDAPANKLPVPSNNAETVARNVSPPEAPPTLDLAAPAAKEASSKQNDCSCTIL